MEVTDPTFWDGLSVEEAQFAFSIMDELADSPWIRPLLGEIDRENLTPASKARLFELRFAYALYQAGISPRYEIPGEADSTLDFGFRSQDQEWLVELMRFEETQAVRDATSFEADEQGTVFSARMLSTDASDRRQSSEGETLKAVQRICQKCERNGRPHKFPPPDGSYCAILVDMRTFLNGGDDYDRIHIGLGGEFVREPMCRMYWEGGLISGVFSARTTVHGAAEARSRVHFIGFVDEKEFAPGAFAASIRFVANPNLFENAEAVRAAIDAWPLEPAHVLNSR